MPPGARPIPRPGVPTQPKQVSQTQAIIQGAQQMPGGGKAALDQRRQAASYGLSGQQQALRDTLDQISTQGQGWSSHPGQTDQYAQWMQAQGFGQQGAPVTIGPKTHAEFKTASLGLGDLRRQQQTEQAQRLSQELGSRYDQLGQQYGQSAATPTGANIAALAGLGAAGSEAQASTLGNMLPGMWGSQGTNRLNNLDRAATIAQVQGRKTGDYLGQLNDWYQKQGEPLVQGIETANQITQTPLRDYELKAAADYGVDPNLAAGWFPESGNIADAANQRNLESLNQTGLPYSEQQSVLQQMTSDQSQQAKQATADQQLQMADDIFGVTNIDAGTLASSTHLPLDALHQVVTDPAFGYDSYAKSVEDTIAADPAAANGDPTAIQDAVDKAIKAMEEDYASTDPNTGEAIARILHSLYDAG